ncbi:MAG: flagellar biosynthesis protein FliQ [Oscillospiraceae bacterium]|nr:flagellar biosynthesis protein FliQ [Oscillospiraceae bacterium]MDY2846644.1 flagellar biosynthesis protein FliQ [Oscillospiraceae bacterium]
MTEETILQIFKDAMLVIFKIAGPLLIISMIVGLVIAIIQAATQVHEQTLTFVPKLVIIGVLLFVLGSFFTTTLMEFMQRIMDMITEVGSHSGVIS